MNRRALDRIEQIARQEHDREHVASWLTCVRCAEIRTAIKDERALLRQPLQRVGA